MTDLFLSSEFKFPLPSRGKCLGDVPLPLSVEEVQKLIEEAKAKGETKITITKPCDCQKFDPLFKPMCTGFGA